MRNRIKHILCLLFFSVYLLQPIPVSAQETEAPAVQIPYEDEIDYNNVQESIDKIMGQDQFDFKAYVYDSIKSGEGFSFTGILETIKETIKKQLNGDKSLIFRFAGITLIGAVFTNFSSVFRNKHVSEMGFYVTYLLIFSMACASFYSITEIAVNTLENILEFMRSLIPAYYMALMFSSGISTSSLFYQGTLILIHLVELFIVHGIMPFIRIYFILALVSNLTEEAVLSKALELLETIIRWTLKTLLGLVTGYNVIQGLVVPVSDNLKNRIAMRAVSALPGVGDLLGSAAETVFGAGIVLKNAIGVAGIGVLAVVLCIPMIRIAFHAFIYKLAAALVQPISDKRMVECLSGCSKAASLLLYAVFVTGVLFLLMIVVIMATTNGRA